MSTYYFAPIGKASRKACLKMKSSTFNDESEFWISTGTQVLLQKMSALALRELRQSTDIFGHRQASNLQVLDELNQKIKLSLDNLIEGNEFYGGVESTAVLRFRLVRSLNKSVAEAKSNDLNAESQINQMKDSILTESANTEFRKVLEEVFAEADVSLKVTSTNALNQIREALNQIFIRMSDIQSKKYTDFFNAAGDIPLDRSFYDLVELSDKDIFAGRDVLCNIPVTYNDAFRKYYTILNDQIDKLMDGEATCLERLNHQEQLMALKVNLTQKQIDLFITSNNAVSEKVATLAKEAQDYSRDEYESIWVGDIEAPFSKLNKYFKEIRRNSDFCESNEIMRDFYKGEANNTIHDLMTDEFRCSGQLLVNLLDKVGKSSLIGDFIRAHIAEKLILQLSYFGDLQSLSVGELFGEFGIMIDDNFPDISEVFFSFIQALDKNRCDLQGLEKSLQPVVEIEGELEGRLKGEVFKYFFSKNEAGTGFVESDQTASEIMTKIFEDESRFDTISYIVEQLGNTGDTSVLDGLKSAYYRHLMSEFFSPEGAVNTDTAYDVENSVSILSMGKVIFERDKSEV